MIAVEPQDDLRYGYRVWIDESSAMPLKTESHTVAGKVVEQLVFTELTLPAHIADSALQPARGHSSVSLAAPHRRDRSGAQPGAPTPPGTPPNCPRGFRLIGNSTQILGDGQKSVTHLVFSDGLASVSVFVEPQLAAAGRRGRGPARAR